MTSFEEKQLTGIFRILGASDPGGWARSQIREGIPQLVRFLFLRQAWRIVVPEGTSTWIEQEIARFIKGPTGPYAGVGRALKSLRELGATDEIIVDLVRGAQAEALFHFCYLLGDPGVVEPEVKDIAWGLFSVDEDGQPIESVDLLHEDVLGTDPTGREMRPRVAEWVAHGVTRSRQRSKYGGVAFDARERIVEFERQFVD